MIRARLMGVTVRAPITRPKGIGYFLMDKQNAAGAIGNTITV